MRSIRKKSQLQEKSVAKDFNAKVVVASGSLWFADSDVRNDRFLIECKTTQKDWYSLSAKVWEKIEKEAIKDHLRIPLMIVDLRDSVRMVVFNPRHFDNPFDINVQDMSKQKSLRLTTNSLKFCLVRGVPMLVEVFQICGDKNNVLVCMYFKDFKTIFKEELD